MAHSDDKDWTVVIKPKSGLFNLKLKELLHYKYLMFLFVRRDFVAQYKQTILGPFWFGIQPLFTTGIYSIIFGSLAKVPTDGVPQPVFYMAGTTLWNYFAACVIGSSTVFTANAGIFGKVYFPRLTVPITQTITKLFVFVIQMVLFLIIYFVYLFQGAAMHPNLWLLFLPVIIAHTALLGTAVGLVSSALTVKYRDLSILISFGINLWMWATPIVYPLSLVPEKYRIIFSMNPMSSMIELFRYSFTGAGSFPVTSYVASLILTFVLLFLGLILFHRAEQTFVDVA
jgi:lipopolysaccharide transport system permease protein